VIVNDKEKKKTALQSTAIGSTIHHIPFLITKQEGFYLFCTQFFGRTRTYLGPASADE
jgi:hypothetical protein